MTAKDIVGFFIATTPKQYITESQVGTLCQNLGNDIQVFHSQSYYERIFRLLKEKDNIIGSIKLTEVNIGEDGFPTKFKTWKLTNIKE